MFMNGFEKSYTILVTVLVIIDEKKKYQSIKSVTDYDMISD